MDAILKLISQMGKLRHGLRESVVQIVFNVHCAMLWNRAVNRIDIVPGLGELGKGDK